MAGLFDDIKAKEPKLPDNIQVKSFINDLIPNEQKQTFNLTTEGNPGESFDFSDIEKQDCLISKTKHKKKILMVIKIFGKKLSLQQVWDF